METINTQEQEGSITVFLTILFLLFFSLFGITFEQVRIESSTGYMRIAGKMAAMALFGDYAKELYEDYGLLGYGGYDGKDTESLLENYTDILVENLKTNPDRTYSSVGDLYQWKEVEATLTGSRNVGEKEMFAKQVERYLQEKGLESLRQKVGKQADNIQKENMLEDRLSMTKDFEQGAYEQKKSQKDAKDSSQQKNLKKEKQPNDKEEKEKKEDEAGGNPLKTFRQLTGHGVLSLVCDEKRLAKGTLEKISEKEKKKEGKSPKKQKQTVAEFIAEIVSKGEEEDVVEGMKEKSAAVLYGQAQFSSYLKDRNRTTRYGMEYLAAGQEEERDNLAYVVKRLLGIRCMTNFAYVVSDRILQEKSLTTATAIAGFTGMPILVQAVQYTILLILSFQEACIDVTALLAGKKIPIIKNGTNFQMAYEEICMASKEMFQKKARKYGDGKEETGGGISYEKYLLGLILTKKRETVQERCMDLIQWDLRKKYNDTFTLENCICHCDFQIAYKVPVMFEKLPFIKQKLTFGGTKSLEVQYGYKSK